MRVPTTRHRLLAAVVLVCSGCSQTGGSRWNAPGGLRTDVSVGDKPVRVVSGEPGSSRTASVEPPDASDRSGARISGRVYDERGRPAEGVRVRLAIAGEPGGKVRATTTDRSGGFTIHDLREGMSYTLIAEQRDGDAVLSGRARADAPAAGIRITLAGAERSAAIRPARPRVEPISRVEDETEEGDRIVNREVPANDEDLPPEAEARRAGAGPGGDGSIRASWSRRDAETRRARQKQAREAAEPVEPILSPSAAGDPPADEEGPNPLPPALEVEEPQAAAASGAAERLAVRDDAPPRGGRAPEAEPWPEEPRPIPDGVLPKRDPHVSDSADVIVIADPPAGTRRQTGTRSPKTPRAVSPARSTAPSSDQSNDAGVARKSPAEPLNRPTWGEVALAQGDVPVDEGLRRTALAPTASDAALAKMADSRLLDPKRGRIAAADADPTQTGRSFADRWFSRRRPQTPEAPVATSCRFDPTERRVLELTLPGLDGKPVSLQSLDADMILLDFWGSWCGPCRGSIPHLIEIQKKLGPKYVQVVGVACERGSTLAERRATAAKAAREMGVSYPVLVSSLDGKCPVQKNLQVQFYPTMILLDREGRILAREQGATEAGLGRIDRAVADRLRAQGALARADHEP